MLRFLTLAACCVLVAQATDATTNRALRAAASSTGNQYWKGPSTDGSENPYWSGGDDNKDNGNKPASDEGSGNKPVNTTYWNEDYSPGQVGYSAKGSGSGSSGSPQTGGGDSKNQGNGDTGSTPSPADSGSAPGGGSGSSPASSDSGDQQSTTETPATASSASTSSASTGTSSTSTDTPSSATGQSSSGTGTSSASTGQSSASKDTSSSTPGTSSDSTEKSSTSSGGTSSSSGGTSSSSGGTSSSNTGTSSSSTDTSSTSSASTGGSSGGKHTTSIVTETSAGSLDSLISTMGTSNETSDTSNEVVQSLKEKGGSSDSTARSADVIAWPTSKGTVPLKAPKLVTRTTPFNGGMKTYKRSNVVYKSGRILSKQNAVFVVKAGGTLRNVIIAGGGGVFCETHNCALVNVWFLNSVEGALIVNSGAGVTTVTGGGSKNVAHRVVYGQGSGTVVISGGFFMETSGRLFESCGTCGPVKRGVIVDGVESVDPTAELVRVNQNYNDRATIAKATITTQTTIFDVCSRYNGGAKPRKLGAGPNPPVCSYTDASVKINSIDQIVPAV